MELLGYCPVTFQQAYSRYEGLVPGQAAFVVEYADKYYAMASSEQVGSAGVGGKVADWCWWLWELDHLTRVVQLAQFQLKPSLYTLLTLPQRLPPPAVQALVGADQPTGHVGISSLHRTLLGCLCSATWNRAFRCSSPKP